MQRKIIAFGFLLLTALAGFAQKPEMNLKDGIAIQGYDPVSYFKEKPTQGKESLTAAFQGATYRFTTVQNREAFQKNPEKYAPKYGGWCAYAMADGDKVSIDPETYKILDGKLYLFYHTFLTNTLTKWNEDETNLHRKADASWKKIH